MDLYRMLKMPRSKTVERMTFGDILGTADQIVANSDGLKVFLSPSPSLIDGYLHVFSWMQNTISSFKSGSVSAFFHLRCMI